MFRILYRFLTLLARLPIRSGRSKVLEIIVLRHQLSVLQRQSGRPQLNDDPAPQRTSVTWNQFLRSQAARNVFLRHADRLTGARALVRERGSQFIDAFDEKASTQRCAPGETN